MPSHPERVRAAGLAEGYQFGPPSPSRVSIRSVREYTIRTSGFSESQFGQTDYPQWGPQFAVALEKAGYSVGGVPFSAVRSDLAKSLVAHNGYDDDFPDREQRGPVEGCEVKGYGHGV